MSRLAFTVERGLGVLRLSSPPRHLMDRPLFEALARFCETDLPSASLRALVVTGEGRHFSAGADVDALVEEVARGGRGLPALLERNLASLEALEALDVPVVAAVRGVCLGSAFELALACHAIVADRHAVFGLPECGFGLLPGCGGLPRLGRRVGAARAAELALRSRTFGAAEAASLGLVAAVTAGPEVEAEARALALRWADAPGPYPALARSWREEAWRRTHDAGAF